MVSGLLSDFAASGLNMNDPQDREELDLIEEIVVAEYNAPSEGKPFHLAPLVPVLKVYRFHQQNPWFLPVVGGSALALGILGLLELGRMLGPRG